MAPQQPVLNHDARLLYDARLSMKFMVYTATKKCMRLLQSTDFTELREIKRD